MGGETYKLNESGNGASASLVFRFLRLHFLLSAIAFPVFYMKLGMANYYIAIIAITAISFLYYLVKHEVEKIYFDNGMVTVKGKRFFFVPFKASVPYSKIKYKFNKPNDRKKGLLKKTPKLILFKENSKWAEFSGGVFGWSKAKLGETVKTLIAKGCYNWFEFNKKSRRKKKS